MSANLILAFYGAAGTVTGSKHLLTYGSARVLIDAGLFQGQKKLRQHNWQESPFAPASIDHVLVTNTHAAHMGALPRLVRMGLTAPVHLTAAAYDLAEPMLLELAKIQEEDARYANKKRFSKHTPALPLYTADDARDALELRRRRPYEEWLELAPGLRTRYWNAGHILGSAFVEVRAAVDGRELTLVFSGDIGRFDAPLHLDPDPRPPCDVLVLESTYGNRLHTTRPVTEQIARPFRDALARGGTVLIPAFAVGRSQQITFILRRMMKAGQLPEVPIHIDSPMAVNATDIYSRFLNRRNVDADVFEDGRLQLFPDNVRFHRTVEESKALNELSGPRILISASGMLTAGRVLHHLERLCGERRNLVVLAGYQAEGTRARALIDGARTIKIHGRHAAVRCHVVSIHGLSGHADRDELLRWVGSTEAPPALACLVHGEPPSAEALGQALEERFGTDTIVPRLGDVVDLAPLAEELAAGEAAARIAAAAPAKEAVTEPLEVAERVRVLSQSPSYQRSDQDADFLQLDALRGVRLELEFLKPELIQRGRGIRGTIAVFGGARVQDPEVARYQLTLARRAAEAEPEDSELAGELALAERRLAQSRYYEVARDLGRIIGRAAGGPDDVRLLTVTGGGPGIMEAANRGADDAGASSIGLNITLPHEQTPNPYVTPELCFQFRYFALRKMHFLLRAKALVAFPGGFGTFDELFETLCLIQTRKVEPIPVVLVGERFWRRAVNFEVLAEEGVISPRDLDLFVFAETAQEVWDHIQGWYEQAGRSLLEG